MEAEGVTFHCNVHIGKDVTAKQLEETHDALLLAGGSEHPFDFFAKSPGRDLGGIHYAMDFLPQQNRRNAGEPQAKGAYEISAKGKNVIVIGGGDTGSDCIGTSIRQGAKSVTQLEIMPKPPEKELKALSWPHWPLKLRISSSQAEGAKTEFSISTTGFKGKDGKVTALTYTKLDNTMQPLPGSEGEFPADLVLFAMGFDGPMENDVVPDLGLTVVPRGRFKGLDANEKDYKVAGAGKKVFAAGDIRRGQSLVVWAIREGRQAAHSIDKFLMGKTTLPR
jgi:glutamate synthase (NADPH/NADH) small chain